MLTSLAISENLDVYYRWYTNYVKNLIEVKHSEILCLRIFINSAVRGKKNFFGSE